MKSQQNVIFLFLENLRLQEYHGKAEKVYCLKAVLKWF
jgi:hypothetical protein